MRSEGSRPSDCEAMVVTSVHHALIVPNARVQTWSAALVVVDVDAFTVWCLQTGIRSQVLYSH